MDVSNHTFSHQGLKLQMSKSCFWNHLYWLNGGSSRDYDHSFFKGQSVTSLFSWPQLYFHKASCVNALSPGRPPHLVDANALGQLFSLSISQSRHWPPTFCIHGSVEVFLKKKSASHIYISSLLYLFTSRVTVYNLQTSELLWWKQGQAIPWIYHPQFPGGPGWICFHSGGFYLLFTPRSGFIKR